MNDFETADMNSGRGGNDPSIILMLGLYLLVLAFFILLVSISTLESLKTQRVMDSLTSTFTSAIPPTTDLTAFQSREGEILAGQQFQEQITGIFSTAIQVIKVETVQPGALMRIVLETSVLFHEGSAEIRQSSLPVFDRIVTALSARPDDQRFDMEFIIGSKFTKNRMMPIGETLGMARVGSFARAILSRGAPPDSVSVGMAPGNPDEIVVYFHVRSADAVKLEFETDSGQDSGSNVKPAPAP